MGSSGVAAWAAAAKKENATAIAEDRQHRGKRVVDMRSTVTISRGS
jgi:hypothetical protein